jgi:palmitoyltransferase ZDHHC13/17
MKNFLHKTLYQLCKINIVCLIVCWSSELNDVAQFLMVLGCNPYYGDAHGDTALHYAARGLNLSLLKYFFNVYGYTILETLNKNNFNIFLTVVIEASDEVSYEILHVLEWLYLNGCSIENQDIHVRFIFFQLIINLSLLKFYKSIRVGSNRINVLLSKRKLYSCSMVFISRC